MQHPTDILVHTMAFVTPVVELWLEQNIAQWVHECLIVYSSVDTKYSYSQQEGVSSLAQLVECLTLVLRICCLNCLSGE